MMRRFFRLIFQLLALAFLFFIGTAVWIVFDGLNDRGDRADVAVVLGHSVRKDGTPGPVLRARLDRAIELYRAGKIPLIVVSGASHPGGYDEAAGMARYLEANQVPAGAIIEDRSGANTDDTARDLARIMAQRNIHSVMIVTHYYHITRTKVALEHAGLTQLSQAHAGVVRKEDAFSLAREVVGLYYYIAKFYLIPLVHQVTEKAKEEAPKVKEDIQKDAQKVEQSLRSDKH